jgi:hypothetical protein
VHDRGDGGLNFSLDHHPTNSLGDQSVTFPWIQKALIRSRSARAKRARRVSRAALRLRRLRHELLEERALLAVFAVEHLGDSGSSSLRGGIELANANSTPDTIEFAVAGTIQLESPLPTVTDNVVIDGTTAPGYLAAPIIEWTAALQVPGLAA